MALPTTEEKGQVDMFAAAPPGISLTQDNTKYPWGNPAKFANPDDAMTAALDSLEKPTNKINLEKLGLERSLNNSQNDLFGNYKTDLETGDFTIKLNEEKRKILN